MDIQAAIDAVALNGGGIVTIPAGSHPNNGQPLHVKQGVILQGAGKLVTFIPPIRNQTGGRIDGVGVRDLTLDGRLAPGCYAANWNEISRGDMRQVNLWYAPHGLVVIGPSYYNVFDGLNIVTTGTALEFYDGANQNTVVGGAFDGSKCLSVIDSNGNSLHGSSLESGNPSAVFYTLSGDAGTTCFHGVRTERPGYGPVMINS